MIHTVNVRVKIANAISEPTFCTVIGTLVSAPSSKILEILEDGARWINTQIGFETGT